MLNRSDKFVEDSFVVLDHDNAGEPQEEGSACHGDVGQTL